MKKQLCVFWIFWHWTKCKKKN